MDTIKENGTGISVFGNKIYHLKFADDIDLLEEKRDELQENLKLLNEAGEASGLKINIEKPRLWCLARRLSITQRKA